MTIATGKEIYNTDIPPVTARGISYTDEELGAGLRGSVSSILWDDSGKSDLQAILSAVATTDFSDTSVKRILSQSPVVEDWRVGEGLAEIYLREHKNCEFPWPSGRDLKNPGASPAGTDLVGFQETDAVVNAHRFAFGEVKTSAQELWPPNVMDGRHGLQKQLEALRDATDVKDALVRYLGHHAGGARWLQRYQSAAARYLTDSSDVSLFGVLIRDVQPKADDLRKRAEVLAGNCPSQTNIELRALYLPKNSIKTLAKRVIGTREGDHGQD
jgi:hypothetical protein